MSGLDYAALFVLLLLAVIAIGVVFFTGNFPGSVAKKRNHPNAEAILNPPPLTATHENRIVLFHSD